MTGPSDTDLELTRRRLFAVAAGSLSIVGTNTEVDAAVSNAVTVLVNDLQPGPEISRYVFGSNEIGNMDGGTFCAPIDAALGIPFRRLGGNRLSTYNWTSNNSNAGHDWLHTNDDFLTRSLGLSPEEAREPAAVIKAAYEASRAMGARTLITLPLLDYVAGDGRGPVPPQEAAPSRRFIPVRWSSAAKASDPVDDTICDIPHLLRRLTATYGKAEAGGIFAYALDNEPGLWSQNHPRLARQPVTIADLISKSLEAARIIKSIDPTALVFGPVSWGATEMMTLQNTPDWPQFADHGSFLAAYLSAFAEEAHRVGQRLLDVLDVHWYPYYGEDSLLNCHDPAMAKALLDAPRSLSESGFREKSWVSRALPVNNTDNVALPILPSLHRLIERIFPGTKISVSEFNYGDAFFAPTALALSDALGRLATSGVHFACHWGALSGYRGDAYRLFLGDGGDFPAFGGRSLPVSVSKKAEESVFAASNVEDRGSIELVIINKEKRPRTFDIRMSSNRMFKIHKNQALTLATAGRKTDIQRIRNKSGSLHIHVEGQDAVRVRLELA